MKPDNVRGVAADRRSRSWDGVNGCHGEKIKIAVIDTGIDYTHANFGGPGTVAAYNAANATDTLPANAALFGPAAPRVKGGIDFVGDDYNADPADPALPAGPASGPEPARLQRARLARRRHRRRLGRARERQHVHGPVQRDDDLGQLVDDRPGVAPKADIYGLRVFGCEGSTDVAVDAIEWAVDHDMDVINMSLGSSFGTTDDPSAVASTNAAKAGVIVVTSAGNSGPNQYITGSPGTADGALSTAANDSSPSFPAVTGIALCERWTLTGDERERAPVHRPDHA